MTTTGRFFGKVTQLLTYLESLGIPVAHGTLPHEQSDFHRLVLANGALVNWWPHTGTLQVQGPTDIADIARKILTHGTDEVPGLAPPQDRLRIQTAVGTSEVDQRRCLTGKVQSINIRNTELDIMLLTGIEGVHPVRITITMPQMIEILSKLKPGDEIVYGGQDFVKSWPNR